MQRLHEVVGIGRDDRICLKHVASCPVLPPVPKSCESEDFAEYAIGHLKRLLGSKMLVDFNEAAAFRAMFRAR